MSATIESVQPPLDAIIPSYLYQEYADDDNLQAFVTAYNTLAQSYLDWFNQTPLAVYVPTAISVVTIDASTGLPIQTANGSLDAQIVYASGLSGPLLDWCATGIYGIARPVLSTLSTQFIAGTNARPTNNDAVNGIVYTQSGTATIASDDIYKRVLTWWLYQGDGKVMSVHWLRRRTARFLFGANGADVPFNDFASVGVLTQPLNPPPSFRMLSVAGGTLSAATYFVRITYVTGLGESLPSIEQSIALAADHVLLVGSVPVIGSAIGWNVYVSTSTGTETKQNSTPIPMGTSWTEPTTGLISGSALPTTNTTLPASTILLTIPASDTASFFEQCVSNNVLSFPFTDTVKVVTT